MGCAVYRYGSLRAMQYDYVEFERERERESRVAWFHGAYVALTSVTLWPKAYALNPKPCWKKEQKNPKPCSAVPVCSQRSRPFRLYGYRLPRIRTL